MIVAGLLIPLHLAASYLALGVIYADLKSRNTGLAYFTLPLAASKQTYATKAISRSYIGCNGMLNRTAR